MLTGLIGFLVLIADIWAILQVFQSGESNGAKALWAAIIIVLPVVGLIVWYFAGPRERSG